MGDFAFRGSDLRRFDVGGDARRRLALWPGGDAPHRPRLRRGPVLGVPGT